MTEVSTGALDLEALRSFVVVAQQGTLAAAADQRNRTVSAISMQIKRLEEHLDTRLLLRGARGVSPTPTGEALLREARELLRQHDNLLARFTGRGLSGTVRFGLPEDYASELVGQILPEFLASHPDVLLEAVTATSGELIKRLQRGELTLAVLLDRQNRLRGGEPLWRTTPVWAAAREARLEGDQPLPLALHPVDCPYRALGVEALEAIGRAWYAVFTSTSINALETAVESGLAVGILDRRRLTPAMRVLDESDGLPSLHGGEAKLYFGQRIAADSRPAVEALAALLRERLHRRAPWPGERSDNTRKG
ncbi:DNA-binding transcriptional regulator, LysR family [Modicisalibacter ilicicola DSM 19980]|uniref:DNA-binding transcriptional regulator, LysR family n=1 Tax=Modicisalibacter ilicicola DSM 19980 TaxID=1121942 RepID=A0A1M5AG17_9GAMM|nr:LysR family transcriptional regulator [Halomonas ilicicola]SHF28832.1 DNA-binding transcriptional regulator, LysR family [Halomonas ilicicola DSM 19980]